MNECGDIVQDIRALSTEVEVIFGLLIRNYNLIAHGLTCHYFLASDSESQDSLFPYCLWTLCPIIHSSLGLGDSKKKMLVVPLSSRLTLMPLVRW